MARAIGTEKRRDVLSVLVLHNQPITERFGRRRKDESTV
jgi:hypothetical protein